MGFPEIKRAEPYPINHLDSVYHIYSVKLIEKERLSRAKWAKALIGELEGNANSSDDVDVVIKDLKDYKKAVEEVMRELLRVASVDSGEIA